MSVARLRILGAAISLLLAAPGSAATFTLDDLVNGTVDSFQSDNGLLTFSDFSVHKLKHLSGNLSNYTVTTVDDGFVLSSSAFAASKGGMKQLNLTYKVTANSLITGASMAMDATQEKNGRVIVEKDIESPDSDEGTFLATLLTKHASILSDSDEFDSGANAFEVEELIRIKKVATLNSVQNSFSVVPEPPELSLLGAGIAGLVLLGRRRSRRA